MKIAVMIGSLSKTSLNRQIYENYKELNKDIFEFIEVEISNFPFYDSGVENFEAVQKANKQIASSDAIIFFSPEYNYSVPAVLKNALDCLSRVENCALIKKPAAIIGASPSPIGTARMQHHLRQICVYMDVRFLNRPEAMLSSANQKLENGRFIDKDTKEFLIRHAKAFEEFIKQNKWKVYFLSLKTLNLKY